MRLEYDVSLIKSHDTSGELYIGNNVFLGKHTLVDYSGQITIEDNVEIANNVIIETHNHPFHTNYKLSHDAIPGNLVIKEGAVIGARAVILPTCHSIGKNARIGAGAVITKDIPDCAIAVGVPAKIIRTME